MIFLSSSFIKVSILIENIRPQSIVLVVKEAYKFPNFCICKILGQTEARNGNLLTFESPRCVLIVFFSVSVILEVAIKHNLPFPVYVSRKIMFWIYLVLLNPKFVFLYFLLTTVVVSAI